jgi:2'-5' RNA ligase
LSPERWRLFFALPIEEPALSALVRWRDDALGGAAVRLPAARDLHITLVFLGGREPEVVPELMRAAHAAVSTALPGPPRLRALRLRALPPRRPRLYALDLSDEGGRLTALHEALACELVASGLWQPEERPFWPHLTVARVPRAQRGRASAPPPPALAAPPAEPIVAARLVLYRSHLGGGGARYEALAEVPFPRREGGESTSAGAPTL